MVFTAAKLGGSTRSMQGKHDSSSEGHQAELELELAQNTILSAVATREPIAVILGNLQRMVGLSLSILSIVMEDILSYPLNVLALQIQSIRDNRTHDYSLTQINSILSYRKQQYGLFGLVYPGYLLRTAVCGFRDILFINMKPSIYFSGPTSISTGADENVTDIKYNSKNSCSLLPPPKPLLTYIAKFSALTLLMLPLETAMRLTIMTQHTPLSLFSYIGYFKRVMFGRGLFGSLTSKDGLSIHISHMESSSSTYSGLVPYSCLYAPYLFRNLVFSCVHDLSDIYLLPYFENLYENAYAKNMVPENAVEISEIGTNASSNSIVSHTHNTMSQYGDGSGELVDHVVDDPVVQDLDPIEQEQENALHGPSIIMAFLPDLATSIVTNTLSDILLYPLLTMYVRAACRNTETLFTLGPEFEVAMVSEGLLVPSIHSLYNGIYVIGVQKLIGLVTLYATTYSVCRVAKVFEKTD